jgi:hypothetical protein
MPADDRRQRRASAPGIPGVRLPNLADDVQRNVQRSHPSFESSEPPPPERAAHPPYELSVFDSSKLPGARLPVVEQAPSSSADVVQIKLPSKYVATVMGAIVTAAIAGFGASKATEKPAASPESIVDLSAKMDRRLYNIEKYLSGAADDQAQRDAVSIAVLCAVNNGPPARSVRCPVNACEPRALDEKGKLIPDQPLCKAREDWPATRRLP